MQKFRSFVVGCLVLFWISGLEFRILAIYDPLSVPNNRFGVHILEPGEITTAAKLVNSAGGEWGYVVVVMRGNDRIREKWEEFFLNARKLKVIPIVRLATYHDPAVAGWSEPTVYDLVDFANFLSDMPWPVKNRYVILFNEPNHSKEWGGRVDPAGYARLLTEANSIFKSRSEDFFLLTAGMDMSAPSNHSSMDALTFYKKMTQSYPEWIKHVDGLAAHAYPNPAFSASVFAKDRRGITSFRHELAYLKKSLPVFITETGSLRPKGFFRPAFDEVWTDKNIVSISPFVLFAGTGELAAFSLLNTAHEPTEAYREIESLKKSAGSPLLSNVVAPTYFLVDTPSALPGSAKQTSPKYVRRFWDKLMRVFSEFEAEAEVGSARFKVRLADDPASRMRGLSGRKKLESGTGMLFVFESPGRHAFWMKDMNFSLDFVWIAAGRVVELTRDVPYPGLSSGRPVSLVPESGVEWVLEIPAGDIDKYGIKIGDEVAIRP